MEVLSYEKADGDGDGAPGEIIWRSGFVLFVR